MGGGPEIVENPPGNQTGTIASERMVPQDYDIHPWELYNLNDDYSQADDLATKYPEKLKEMEKLFDEEAKRNQGLSPAAWN